mmetsp:Transcript_100262/g.189052  ORF Transcript_100262/g.189052 Transcript_100262/m.189052 type:complete len:215 (-) Transcript_100262:128-772(-)
MGLEDLSANERQIVAALAKQTKVDETLVERIFSAGVDHVERIHKRRRISSNSDADAAPASVAAPEAVANGASASSDPAAPATEAVDADGKAFSFTSGVTFEQFRTELAEFALERDWDQFHSPRNLILALVGEVGELAEIFQWKGEVPVGLTGWSDKNRTHVGQELADIFLYLIRLSHKCHVDLPQVALDKLALNAAKYPAKLVKGSSRKYNEYT